MIRMLIYVDLLGFKNQVKTAPLQDVVRKLKDLLYAVYAGAIRYAVRSGEPVEALVQLPAGSHDGRDLDLVVGELRKRTKLSVLLMSDSLVLYSEPVRSDEATFAKQLTSLVLVGRIVMLKLFEFHLPARGAISLGEFHADPRNSIFCGRALIEAYELAESQEWIGMSICDSLAGHINSLLGSFSIESFAKASLAERRWNILRPDWDVIGYEVPLKQGPQNRWVVNWSSAWNAGGPVREDFFGEQMTGEESVDRKYQNTLAYLQWFHRRNTTARDKGGEDPPVEPIA